MENKPDKYLIFSFAIIIICTISFFYWLSILSTKDNYILIKNDIVSLVKKDFNEENLEELVLNELEKERVLKNKDIKVEVKEISSNEKHIRFSYNINSLNPIIYNKSFSNELIFTNKHGDVYCE